MALSSPGFAAVLSFVFNGLGQIYNGQLTKGLLIIFLSAVSMLIFTVGSLLLGLWLLGKVGLTQGVFIGLAMFFTGLVLICAIGIYSIKDAYRVALKK